jgi:hypothetical protein
MKYEYGSLESLGLDDSLAINDSTSAAVQELDTLTDINVSTEEVIEAAKASMDFLAAFAMPTIYKYAFPKVFLAIWQWVLGPIHKVRDFSQLAIGLPRGFGKTFVVKLIVLYAILFTNKKFIIIISEIESKAISIISDISDMLDEPNVRRVFGNWRVNLTKDQQALKVFSFRGRPIILKAAGAGSSIRGINEKNSRPDVMVFEDIQSKEDSKSEILSDALEEWIYSTAMKAKDPSGCLFLFIANMYPTKGSLLRKFKKHPNWVKFIVGGILSDGTSLWEQLQPIAQLLKEFQNDLATGHPEIFYSEVLNDENASSNHHINISNIPEYPYLDSDIPEGRFIIIDPSGDKTKSDAVSIGLIEIFQGIGSLRKVIEGRLSPGDTIREALKLALTNGVSVIIIEGVAFQYSLLYWFNFITEQLGISGIQPVDIYPGRSSKNSRISDMFLQLPKNEILIHPDARTPAFSQITQFNMNKKDNTDGILDLLTYIPKAIDQYGALIRSSFIIQDQEFSDIEISQNTSPF